MLIRKEPKNPEKYLIVDSNVSNILHRNGFKPMYMSFDGNKIYFKKEQDLMDFVYSNNIL